MQHINVEDALNGTSWAEHRALVLTKLSENSEAIGDIRDTIQQMAVLYADQIARLQVRSGVIGFLGGLVPVLLTLGIVVIVYLIKK